MTTLRRLLQEESRRAGGPFKEIVNETLRAGLSTRRAAGKRQAFRITPRELGEVKPGLSLDNIGELIEQAQGPVHR